MALADMSLTDMYADNLSFFERLPLVCTLDRSSYML